MNYFRYFGSLVPAAAILFCACHSNDTKQSPLSDTMPATAAVTTPAEQIPDVLLAMHRVADFGKWLPVYEAHDSARRAAGLHNFVIGRGVEDSNMVLVALKMDDVANARAFIADTTMKTVMQRAGVKGAPEFRLIDQQTLVPSTDPAPVRILVTHKVKSWSAWKQAFDNHEQARRDAGLTVRGTGFSADDSSLVTVVLNVNDMEKARAFINSKDLAAKMKEAGVQDKPRVFMYRVVKLY